MTRGMPRRSLVSAVLGTAVMLLAGVLAGCGGSSGGGASASGSGGGGTTSIKVGVPGTYGTMIGLYLAQDKGYFAKQGLNVQIVPFTGDAPAVKAIVGGAVDVNVASLAGMLQGVEHGASLKVIYGGFDQATALDWYGKRPIDWSHVKGTKWGVSSPGSSTDFLTRYLVQRHGISPNDITMVSTGGSAGDLSALKSGEVNYVIMAPELGVIAAKEDGAKLVARQSDLMSEYPFHVVYATSSWIASHQKVATEFLRALVQGMKLSLSDPSAGIQEQAKILKGPLSVAKATYSTNVNGSLHPDGALPDSTSMSDFWQIGIQNGLFARRLPQSQWVDPKWINSYPAWTK